MNQRAREGFTAQSIFRLLFKQMRRPPRRSGIAKLQLGEFVCAPRRRRLVRNEIVTIQPFCRNKQFLVCAPVQT
jgi:hypothetical protein